MQFDLSLIRIVLLKGSAVSQDGNIHSVSAKDLARLYGLSYETDNIVDYDVFEYSAGSSDIMIAPQDNGDYNLLQRLYEHFIDFNITSFTVPPNLDDDTFHNCLNLAVEFALTRNVKQLPDNLSLLCRGLIVCLSLVVTREITEHNIIIDREKGGIDENIHNINSIT